MNFEWLSKTSACLFSSCRFLLSSDVAFLRLSIWQKNERIYYWWYWKQNENIGKMVLLNKVTFILWHFSYSLGNRSLYWYELEQLNCTKISITSSIVFAWTRKTFWLNILVVLEATYVKLFPTQLNKFISKRLWIERIGNHSLFTIKTGTNMEYFCYLAENSITCLTFFANRNVIRTAVLNNWIL